MADPRGISVATPLGPDALFLTAFRGHEGISQLFHFQLELLADNRQAIAFDKLIGQTVSFSILLPDGTTKRFWNGICNSFAQSGRDSTFTTYRMEVAPQLWLLTRRKQSRIFQHISIPDILKKVLAGLDIKLELQGTFERRDYCVQYRESDFDFACRLMEEEGIYYFFKHAEGTHQMVLANTPKGHPDVPFAATAIYEELEGGNRPDMRVHRWEKVQELRSGKVTLWDHCFELPNQRLDAERPTTETVDVGKVAHKLKLPANDALELYDYPGGYAGRFDGIDQGGGVQAAELQKIFQDNKRTAAIRMDQEAAQAILIRGASNCRQFMAGHKFTLERHFNADGPYVLTTVEHSASTMAGRSGGDPSVSYSNHFTCLPFGLPYRPPQTTPRPKVAGPQSATVVGPAGEEIHTDKYSRVKVQLNWDRHGKHDGDSSCWVRVATHWAGKGFGLIHIPRIGQEVVVDFLEGDPDQPIIVGSVYNAENMPPYELPKNKTQSGIQTRSSLKGTPANYNEIRFEDLKGKEEICVHAEKDMNITVENNYHLTVGTNPNASAKKGGTHTETIFGDTTVTIAKGDFKFDVQTGNSTTDVKGVVKETYKNRQETTVQGNIDYKSNEGDIKVTATAGVLFNVGAKEVKVESTADAVNVYAATLIKLHCGGSEMTLKADGTIEVGGSTMIKLAVGNNTITIDTSGITISGAKVTSTAVGLNTVEGEEVKLNC